MAGYVLDNDDFVSSGYVDTTYVGTDADLIYVESGYVGIFKFASASLSVAASLSADALDLERSSASLSVAASFSGVANPIRSFSSSISAASSTTGTPTRVRPFSATLGGDGAASISAVATVSPSVDISANASSSVSAVATKVGSATFVQAGDETTWETALTWAAPRQEVWALRFDIDPSFIRTGQATLNSNSTVAVDGDRTARIDIVVQGAGSLSIDPTIIVSANATLSSEASITRADGTTNVAGELSVDSSASVSVRGTYQVLGTSSPNVVSSINVEYTRIRTDSGQFDAAGNIAVEYTRLRRHEKQLDNTATMLVDGDRIGRGTVLEAGISTLSCDALRGRGMVDYEIPGVATVSRALGGRLRGLLNEQLITESLASVQGQLFNYVIDPYRVYVVKTEGRSLEIVEETRENALKSENRVNTITAESRGYVVRSETRTAEVQNLALIDVFGPNDRREG